MLVSHVSNSMPLKEVWSLAKACNSSRRAVAAGAGRVMGWHGNWRMFSLCSNQEVPLRWLSFTVKHNVPWNYQSILSPKCIYYVFFTHLVHICFNIAVPAVFGLHSVLRSLAGWSSSGYGLPERFHGPVLRTGSTVLLVMIEAKETHGMTRCGCTAPGCMVDGFQLRVACWPSLRLAMDPSDLCLIHSTRSSWTGCKVVRFDCIMLAINTGHHHSIPAISCYRKKMKKGLAKSSSCVELICFGYMRTNLSKFQLRQHSIFANWCASSNFAKAAIYMYIMYIYMYIYITYTFTHTHLHIHIYTYTHTHIHIYTHTSYMIWSAADFNEPWFARASSWGLHPCNFKWEFKNMSRPHGNSMLYPTCLIVRNMPNDSKKEQSLWFIHFAVLYSTFPSCKIICILLSCVLGLPFWISCMRVSWKRSMLRLVQDVRVFEHEMCRMRWQQDVVLRNCRLRCRQVIEYTWQYTWLTCLLWRLSDLLDVLYSWFSNRTKDRKIFDHPFEGNWELLQNCSLLLDQCSRQAPTNPFMLLFKTSAEKITRHHSRCHRCWYSLEISWNSSALQAANICHQCFRSCQRLLHFISLFFCRVRKEPAPPSYVKFSGEALGNLHIDLRLQSLIPHRLSLKVGEGTHPSKPVLEAMIRLISVTIPTAGTVLHLC